MPEEYVLQPVTSKLPHYNDFTEEHADLHQQAKREWWETFEAFQRLLRAASRAAVDRNRLTHQHIQKYFCSGEFNPFTLKSDQFQISPAASQEI